MATSRVRDIGAIWGAQAPISTDRPSRPALPVLLRDDEREDPEQTGVEQPERDQGAALAEPVDGGAEQRAGERGAEAGGGGVEPAEGHRAALGDDQGEDPDDIIANGRRAMKASGK